MRLVHVEAGIKLNELLDNKDLALTTMGGSSGQSLQALSRRVPTAWISIAARIRGPSCTTFGKRSMLIITG